MNTNITRDLFPETLLVEVSEGKVFTTSLKVAEHFKMRHDNVLRIIRRMLKQVPEEKSLLNFEERLDHYSVGGKRQAKRTRTIFELTHDGFAILAMSFTGEEAMRWKWDFLDAFRAMERHLAALKEREASALYALRPRWKPIVQHPDLKRGDLIALTGHRSPGSITACRRRMREVGLLETGGQS